ncbi:MAG: GNAT family N-acetyltransferase [Clostridiales bacterium]|nr:GNAT family N-acetyltransferase [Clostridiales bacterium]
MDFSYRKATIEESNQITRIYESAQAFMEAHGNPQWAKGFPDENDVRGGIYGGILYCVIANSEIAAVFAAVNHDGNYDEIEGSWLTEGNYIAVHRVAVSEKYRSIGAAKFIINHAAEELARTRGRTSIRIDTHEMNKPMRGLLISQGFTECGSVYISRDYSKRIAYEKIL